MTRKPLVLALLALLTFSLFGPAAASAGNVPTGVFVDHQAGGEPGPVVASGTHLYQALGPSIVTWTNTAAAPSIESVSTALPGLVVGLVKSGSFLYAAVRTSYPNGYLAVFSLADPAKPVLVNLKDYSDSFLSSPSALIAGSSGLLYLADLEIGILVVDTSNPTNPGVTVGYDGPGIPADELGYSDDWLVAWGQNFFGNLTVQVFDIKTPAVPASLGSFSAGLALGGTVEGKFFYSIGFGFEIFDFSNLSNVQSVFQNGDAASRDLLVSGGRLYFGNADGLHVWNVSTPASATEIAVVPAPLDRSEQSAVIQVGADPKLAFFTQQARGLRFSTATTPVLEHTFSLPGAADATGIADRGDRVFAADFYSGAKALDRVTLANAGRYDLPADQLGAVEGIDIVGNRAYIANWGFGLLIVDIANLAAPALLGSVAIDFATSVEVVGNFAYVVTSTNGGILFTVNVSNPASPQIVASVPTTKGMEVMHHNGLLLVADESFGDPGGLRIFSLANPAAPTQVSLSSACDSAAGLDAAGSRVYLACSDGTLRIIDITNPSAPSQLGIFSDPDPDILGDARDVAVRGPRAFFGRGDYVYSIDVSSPAAPVLESRADLASAVRRIAIGPTAHPWVAAGPAGVYRLDSAIWSDGFEIGTTAAWSSTVP